MSLQRRILRTIDDAKPVLSHSDQNQPLKDLIASYMVHAVHNDQLPNITNLTTGLELKEALELLEPDVELDLLKQYSDGRRAALYPHLKPVSSFGESQAAIDERRQRHWMARFFMMTGTVLVLMIAGGVITLGYKAGAMPDSKVFSSIMTTVSDIAKLIFSTK